MYSPSHSRPERTSVGFVQALGFYEQYVPPHEETTQTSYVRRTVTTPSPGQNAALATPVSDRRRVAVPMEETIEGCSLIYASPSSFDPRDWQGFAASRVVMRMLATTTRWYILVFITVTCSWCLRTVQRRMGSTLERSQLAASNAPWHLYDSFLNVVSPQSAMFQLYCYQFSGQQHNSGHPIP